jgi:hypothetical protein
VTRSMRGSGSHRGGRPPRPATRKRVRKRS